MTPDRLPVPCVGQVEECRAPHAQQTLDLLRAAHEALLRGAGGAGAPAKSLHHVSMLMGQEMMAGGDLKGARALLEEVAGGSGVGSKGAWDTGQKCKLWSTLGWWFGGRGSGGRPGAA